MYLAASSGEKVYIWNVDSVDESSPPPDSAEGLCETAAPAFTYDPRSGESGGIRQMAWNPRTCKLVSLSQSGSRVHIQRISSGDAEQPHEEIHKLTKSAPEREQECNPSSSVTCFAFPQRVGHYFATGCANGAVMVHVYNKQFILRSQFGLTETTTNTDSLQPVIIPTCITWALQDRLLVLGTNRGELYATPAAAGRKIDFQAPHRLAWPGSDNKIAVCLTLRTSRMDSSLVAAGYANGMVVIWQLDWPLSEETAHHLSTCFIPEPTLSGISFNESVSIAFPALTTQLLITAGAPDLCARVWHWHKSSKSSTLSSHGTGHEKVPFYTLKPQDKTMGFLVADLASDSFTLATGLMNGEVWLYDLRALSAPRLRLGGFTGPVRHLAFALSLQSHDEVRFKDSVSADRSQHPFSIDSTSDNLVKVTTSSIITPISEHGGPLTDITNRSGSPIRSSAKHQWNAVFHDVSVPELSLNSSETNQSRRTSSQAPLSPSSLTQLTLSPMSSTDNEPDSIERVNAELTFGPFNPVTPIAVAQPSPPKVKQTPMSGLAVETELDRRLANFESNLRSELCVNQSELLFYFSRLECEVRRMRTEFTEALTQLHRENEALKRELHKHTYFY